MKFCFVGDTVQASDAGPAGQTITFWLCNGGWPKGNG